MDEAIPVGGAKPCRAAKFHSFELLTKLQHPSGFIIIPALVLLFRRWEWGIAWASCSQTVALCHIAFCDDFQGGRQARAEAQFLKSFPRPEGRGSHRASQATR